jgi:hypothetical protein
VVKSLGIVKVVIVGNVSVKNCPWEKMQKENRAKYQSFPCQRIILKFVLCVNGETIIYLISSRQNKTRIYGLRAWLKW